MTKNKLYLTVYESIRRDIIHGAYKKGDKIPSKRTTALEWNVSLITVEHAYELLLDEGYIVSKEKRGYFVIYDSEYNPATQHISPESEDGKEAETESGAEAKAELEQTVEYSLSPMSYNIFSKAARRVLTEYGEEIMLKSPGSGTVILREAIAGYLNRSRHIDVSFDQIIIGSGAEYLYGLIVQAFGRDRIYAVEDPCYSKIIDIYEAGGVTLERLRLGKDGINSKSLQETQATILHISPYRSYPSRVSATINKKQEYIRWSSSRDAIIIEDDVESEFSPIRKNEETLFSLDRENRVIYINSFTMTIGASLRIAYMVIPRTMKPFLRERIGFYSCPAPTYQQYILAELIMSGDFERHINRVRRNIRKDKGKNAGIK